jgi:hypothetical protein
MNNEEEDRKQYVPPMQSQNSDDEAEADLMELKRKQRSQ